MLGAEEDTESKQTPLDSKKLGSHGGVNFPQDITVTSAPLSRQAERCAGLRVAKASQRWHLVCGP